MVRGKERRGQKRHPLLHHQPRARRAKCRADRASHPRSLVRGKQEPLETRHESVEGRRFAAAQESQQRPGPSPVTRGDPASPSHGSLRKSQRQLPPPHRQTLRRPASPENTPATNQLTRQPPCAAAPDAALTIAGAMGTLPARRQPRRKFQPWVKASFKKSGTLTP